VNAGAREGYEKDYQNISTYFVSPTQDIGNLYDCCLVVYVGLIHHPCASQNGSLLDIPAQPMYTSYYKLFVAENLLIRR
jgi:hypothetical protein